jgi:hypothetical protein
VFFTRPFTAGTLALALILGLLPSFYNALNRRRDRKGLLAELLEG